MQCQCKPSIVVMWCGGHGMLRSTAHGGEWLQQMQGASSFFDLLAFFYYFIILYSISPSNLSGTSQSPCSKEPAPGLKTPYLYVDVCIVFLASRVIDFRLHLGSRCSHNLFVIVFIKKKKGKNLFVIVL